MKLLSLLHVDKLAFFIIYLLEIIYLPIMVAVDWNFPKGQPW